MQPMEIVNKCFFKLESNCMSYLSDSTLLLFSHNWITLNGCRKTPFYYFLSIMSRACALI